MKNHQKLASNLGISQAQKKLRYSYKKKCVCGCMLLVLVHYLLAFYIFSSRWRILRISRIPRILGAKSITTLFNYRYLIRSVLNENILTKLGYFLQNTYTFSYTFMFTFYLCLSYLSEYIALLSLFLDRRRSAIKSLW